MRRIAIGVVAAAMVIAACGGSSKKSVAAGGSTTTSGSAGNNSSSTTTAGGGDPFGTLTGKASTADIKITYTQDGDKPFTVIQDGKGKSAYINDGSEYTTDGTTTVSCDGTTSTATCTQLPSTGAAAASPFAFFTSLATDVGTSSPSDFEPPSTPQTIPPITIPTGITLPGAITIPTIPSG